MERQEGSRGVTPPDQPVLPITVVIPVRNEEANLGACLDRLHAFASVVVVDSSSTDRTREIAEAAGATYLNFEWNGTYPKKRNWYLLNHQPDTEWVMFLDADEFVTPEFCRVVARAIADSPNNGFWLSYSNHFMGRRLDHGVEQRKLALFRTGKALYERIDEDRWSNLDMEVHEHPVVEGRTGTIAERIDHRDERGLPKFLDRHTAYARWEARRTLALRAGNGTEASHLSSRQRFKYRHIHRWWYPWFYFAWEYIAKRGFLDGRAGFSMAFYKLWYFYSIRLLIKEQQN